MQTKLSALIIIILLSSSTSKLLFAFEMFRHGARAPTMLYDDNTDYFGQKWIKKMELTSTGLRQHYIVGVRNREKLIDEHKLLSDTFDPKEIKVFSTETDRTLNSASAQLQGLYPPGKGGKLINKEQIERAVPPISPVDFKEEKEQLGDLALPNQIDFIPIHTIYPQDNDFFLYSPTYCPNLKDYFDKNNQRPELLKSLDDFNTKYQKDICSLLKGNSTCIGHNISYALNIFETIHAEYVDDRDMKQFSDKGINVDKLVDDCIAFAALHLIGSGIDNDKKIGQVGMSPTMRKIFDWMEKAIENKGKAYDYDHPKLVMISAHDASMGAFEALLKAAFNFEIKFSSFASNLFLELYVDDAIHEPALKDYIVKYVFDDEEIGSLTYTQFVDKMKPLLMTADEIEDFCQFNTEKSLTILWIVLISLFVIINSVLIGFIIHYCINKPKPQNYTEIKDNTDKTY